MDGTTKQATWHPNGAADEFRVFTFVKHHMTADIYVEGVFIGSVDGQTVGGRIVTQFTYTYAADNHSGRLAFTSKQALEGILKYHETWLKKPIVKQLVMKSEVAPDGHKVNYGEWVTISPAS